ncbi:MAG TPA: hypothetical protein VFY44_06365, partial [Thermoleophilaceae bacterium]|nr:hypothetical protein [Thermoleophilaceae bacterium]
MCVALLALFVAMGGSAYAAKKIRAKDIGTGAVGTRAVKNGSLAGTDIRGNSLGPGTIAEQSLDTKKLKTVPTARVAGTVVKNAVGASELANVTRRFGGAVTIVNGQAAKADVGCAKGEIALGGGGRWDNTGPGLSLQSSYADTDTGWTAIGFNASGGSRKLQA